MPPRRRRTAPATGLKAGDIVVREGGRTRYVVTGISDGENYTRTDANGERSTGYEPAGWARMASIDGNGEEFRASSPGVLRRVDNPDAATLAAAARVAPNVTGRRNGTPNVGANVNVPSEAPRTAARSSLS